MTGSGVLWGAAIAGLMCMTMSPGCSRALNRAEIGTAESSVDLPGVNNLSRDGSFYFSGQPSRETLDAAAGRGVRVVVNLRSGDEMQSGVDFDEAATAQALGMRYVSIPITPTSFGAADADRLHEVLQSTPDPVLIHCATSNRTGALWAMYLNRHRGLSIDDALERGRHAGLRSEQLADTVRREARR